MKHSLYWLTIDSCDEVGCSNYYLKDARIQAKKLAKELHRDIFINSGDDIIDVVFCPVGEVFLYD